MALRCEGQTLNKKKDKLSVKLSVLFFSEQSVGMTLARRYDWSGTPLMAGLRPAAAHLRGSAHAADPGEIGEKYADFLEFSDFPDCRPFSSSLGQIRGF